MTKAILSVPAISCEGCVRHVTNALKDLEGVRLVNVSLAAKQAQVEFDEGVVSLETMMDVLAEEEYPVEAVQTV